MCSLQWALVGVRAVQGINNDRALKQQANAQAAVYNQQAKAAEQNAAIESRKQEQQSHQYAQKQEELNSRRRLTMGANAASAGASGFSNTGSVEDVDSAVNDQYQLDSMNLLGNQRNSMWDSYMNQTNLLNEASANRSAARNVKASLRGQRLANFLSTAANMYGTYRTYMPAEKEPKVDKIGVTGFTGNVADGTLKYDFPSFSDQYRSDDWKDNTGVWKYQDYDVTGKPVMPTFGLPKSRTWLGTSSFSKIDPYKWARQNDPFSVNITTKKKK